MPVKVRWLKAQSLHSLFNTIITSCDHYYHTHRITGPRPHNPFTVYVSFIYKDSIYLTSEASVHMLNLEVF